MTSLHRRSYIDWARGIAVLLMIEAHTIDAWTRAADRSTIGYRNATILGGFAAPLFLWLAGLALVLSATRTAERAGHRTAAVNTICRRGLEIFVLAFLFRLQAFIISPGQPVVALFRVDILNVMGPAIVLAGLVWGLATTSTRRIVAFAALAIAAAMLTPVVRTAAWVGALPVWVQWYLKPAGEHTTFTMFPWAGFVFAGSAVGALLATARDDRVERRLQQTLAAAGVAVVVLGFYSAAQPSIYGQSSFWTSSPAWFAIRAGIMLIAVACLYASAAVAERVHIRLLPLERLGRSSLFVYWIHVELVYGYASWLWRRRLPLWGTFAASALLVMLMYGAVMLRDRVARARPLRSVTEPASA